MEFTRLQHISFILIGSHLKCLHSPDIYTHIHFTASTAIDLSGSSAKMLGFELYYVQVPE